MDTERELQKIAVGNAIDSRDPTLYRQATRIILCVVLAGLKAACSDTQMWWEPLPPGTLVVEGLSPDRELSAVVIAQKKPGSYTLEIRRQVSQERLARRVIAAPAGYHAHLITVEWSPDGEQVTATIDHDFGDNTTVFELTPD